MKKDISNSIKENNIKSKESKIGDISDIMWNISLKILFATAIKNKVKYI